MATTVRTEKRQRGVFGHLIKWIFIAFNVLMFVWLVSGLVNVSEMDVSTDAERVGQAIGTTIGVYMIVSLWTSGVVVLGILVLLTRGNKVIVEETMSDRSPGGGSFGTQAREAEAAIARYMQQQQQPPTSAGLTAVTRPTQRGFGRR